MRRRHRLLAWVASWAASAPGRWAEPWREYARTGWSFELDFASSYREPGWRTYGVQAGLAAYRQGRRP